MTKIDDAVRDSIQRWPTKKSRNWLLTFLRSASKDPNVLAAVAVGSAVRPGVPSEDLDLVAICRDEVLFAYRAPIEIDLRPFCLDSLDQKIAGGHDLLGWSVKFGRPLLDKRNVWQNTVDRWKTSLPLPDPATARSRAEIAVKQMAEMLEVGDTDAALELRLTHLTHAARGQLSEAGVYPASRPELPDQLRAIGATSLVRQLTEALEQRADAMKLRPAV